MLLSFLYLHYTLADPDSVILFVMCISLSVSDRYGTQAELFSMCTVASLLSMLLSFVQNDTWHISANQWGKNLNTNNVSLKLLSICFNCDILYRQIPHGMPNCFFFLFYLWHAYFNSTTISYVCYPNDVFAHRPECHCI